MSIRKTLFSIALTGAFAVPAFAGINSFGGEYGEATYQVQQSTVGTKSRAEVEAEVLRARQDGTLTYIGGYPRGVSPGTAQPTTGISRAHTSQMGAPAGSDVSADGYRTVGGEIGYIYVGPQRK